MNLGQISAKLRELPIEELSFSTDFQIRHDGAIKGYDFVLAFFLMALEGFNTVEKWAATIGTISGNLISAQSLQGKLQFRHQQFAEALLKHVVRRQLMNRPIGTPAKGLLQAFGRVFLEDSSCVKLPAALAAFFPGNYNHAGPGATARVQLRIELLSGEYTYLELQSYRDNDQKFAWHIIGQIQKRDLVIRDLGYGVLRVFRYIGEMEAFYLSRLKYGICVYDPKTGQEINLLKKLRSLRHQGISVLDINIEVGKDERLPVRLVAVLAPPNVAQERRRKAEKDRNKKANHSEDYMEMLGWSIFITNVPAEVWTPGQIMEVYGYRWHIEIIFKCWKSRFDFARLFDKKKSMTPARAVISFCLLLIWLTLFYARWYHNFLLLVFEQKKKWLSPLKFADFVKEHFEQLLTSENPGEFVEFLARYCCYNKRKAQPNQMEKIYLLNLS